MNHSRKGTFGSAASLTALAILAMFAMVGCGGDRQATSSEAASATEVVIQLNWFPESEHGGVFAAEAAGYYADAGLDVTIRAGGQGTRIAPELASGRVQFAFANADDVVLFREEGVDAVAVLAAMQNHPRCVLVRADSGVTELSQLSGMILQRQAGRPFLAFLESRGLLEGVQQVPYAGSVAGLVSDPKTAIQAYSFAEPLLARQQGLEVNTLMVSELGWNPYSSVLVTTGELIREQPELVEKVVRATRRGWQTYLENPDAAHRAILAVNEHGMTAKALDFGYQGLRALALPDGFPIEEVGRMSSERWETLVSQMAEIDLVDPAKVDGSSCFTNEFLGP